MKCGYFEKEFGRRVKMRRGKKNRKICWHPMHYHRGIVKTDNNGSVFLGVCKADGRTLSFHRVSTLSTCCWPTFTCPPSRPSLAPESAAASVFGSHRWNDGTVLDRGRCGKTRFDRARQDKFGDSGDWQENCQTLNQYLSWVHSIKTCTPVKLCYMKTILTKQTMNLYVTNVSEKSQPTSTGIIWFCDPPPDKPK